MENESITNGKDKTMEKVPKKRERRRKPDEAWTLFKSTYRDEKGERKESKTWSLDFRDCQDKRQRLSLGVSQRRTAESYAAKIDELKALRMRGEGLSSGLTVWLESISESLQKKLCKIGLIDERRIKSGWSLSKHLKDYETYLTQKGNTTKHVDRAITRIKTVFNRNLLPDVPMPKKKKRSKPRKVLDPKKRLGGIHCGFNAVSDIDGNKIVTCIGKYRELEDGISQQTARYYLEHCKAFCNWLVMERRATENPLLHLTIKKPDTSEKNRRALDIDQFRQLLDVTATQPTRFGLSGYERYLLYRVASETGMRAGEIRSLSVSSFDLDDCTVIIEAAYSKRRRRDVIELRADTCKLLDEYFQGKESDELAFHGTYKRLTDKTADMLKLDLQAAGLPYRDEDGEDFDFHSLRHQFATLLDQTDCTLKERQERMRHSTINLTMRYTHAMTGRSGTLNKLPDLSLSSHEIQEAKATGTYDERNSTLAKPLPNSKTNTPKPKTTMDKSQKIGEKKNPHSKAKNSISESKKADSDTGPGRDRTCDQGIMSPLTQTGQNQSQNPVNTRDTTPPPAQVETPPLAKPLPNSAADTGISEDILLIRKLCDKLDKADRQRLAALLDNM